MNDRQVDIKSNRKKLEDLPESKVFTPFPGVRATDKIFLEPDSWAIYTHFVHHLGPNDFPTLIHKEEGFKLRLMELWTHPVLEVKIVPRQVWAYFKAMGNEDMPWSPSWVLKEKFMVLKLRTLLKLEEYLRKEGVIEDGN